MLSMFPPLGPAVMEEEEDGGGGEGRTTGFQCSS